MRTYTFNECYERLHVDPKTFRGWLKEAGIESDHQVSRADRRIRFLTHEQLSQLAEEHGRLLGGSTETSEEAIPVGAFKLLLDRMTRAEEEMARHQPRLLEATHSLEEKLAQSQQEFKESHLMLKQQITNLVLAQTNHSQSLKEELETLERKVDQVRGELTSRLNHISAEQQAALDKIGGLQEQLDTHGASHRTEHSTLETSRAAIQALLDGLQLTISALEKDQALSLASLASHVEKEREKVWLLLTELSSEASSSKTTIAEIKSRSDEEELRLTELSRLVQEELRLSQTSQIQKVRRKPAQHRAPSERERLAEP